jgi:hypothetical protein
LSSSPSSSSSSAVPWQRRWSRRCLCNTRGTHNPGIPGMQCQARRSHRLHFLHPCRCHRSWRGPRRRRRTSSLMTTRPRRRGHQALHYLGFYPYIFSIFYSPAYVIYVVMLLMKSTNKKDLHHVAGYNPRTAAPVFLPACRPK